MEESNSRQGKQTVSILGCRVDNVDQAGAVKLLASFLEEERPHLVVTADASMLVRAQDDPELHRILEQADLVVPDSIGVVWASRLLGTPVRERVAGVDLLDKLASYCASSGRPVFLLGAAPGVAEKAAEKLQGRHPGLLIAGVHHGFFTTAEEPEIIGKIQNSQAQVLFAAMGIPRQEKWLHRRLPELPVRIGMGVGGSLDVFAGTVKRAPKIFQRFHLEWLYRTLSDPRRYRKAMMLPIFAILTIREWLAQRGILPRPTPGG